MSTLLSYSSLLGLSSGNYSRKIYSYFTTAALNAAPPSSYATCCHTDLIDGTLLLLKASTNDSMSYAIIGPITGSPPNCLAPHPFINLSLRLLAASINYLLRAWSGIEFSLCS